MRQTAARLNRTWLIIIGLLVLLVGLAMVVISTGLLAPAASLAGLQVSQPTPTNHLFGAATTAAFTLTWVVILTAVVAVIIGLLALGWLLAQIPRTNEAKPFRLHDDARTGLTRCAPSVITDAVEDQVEALPGVQHASAVLRGTAAQPDLTLKVAAGDRTDIPRLLSTLQNQVGGGLAESLDTQLARLGVQIEIDTTKIRSDRITL